MPGWEPDAVRMDGWIIGEETLTLPDDLPIYTVDMEVAGSLAFPRRIVNRADFPAGVADGDIVEETVRSDLVDKAEFAVGDPLRNLQAGLGKFVIRLAGERRRPV